MSGVMDRRMRERVWHVHIGKWLVRVRVYMFVYPYSLSESGLWPFGIGVLRWRVHGHFWKVADMGVVIE